MKFVINAQICKNANEQLADELQPLLQLFGADGRAVRDAIRNDDVAEITNLKHISVVRVSDDWHIWVDDGIVTRHLSLVGKVARFVAPIAMMFKTFAHEFTKELAEVQAWIVEEK